MVVKNRIELIDCAKEFAIILVVFGHALHIFLLILKILNI